MSLSIHIEPQFAQLRAEMRRYRPDVIEKSTVRTLNRLAAKARTQARRGIARHFRIPQKNIANRIRINKATRHRQHVIIGFAQSRTSGQIGRSTGSLLITPGSLYRHLQDAALLKRYEGLPPGPHTTHTARPFIQRPRGYRIVLARQTAARYPLTAPRIDLAPIWRSLQTQLRAQAAADYPAEWRRNAEFYNRRRRR